MELHFGADLCGKVGANLLQQRDQPGLWRGRVGARVTEVMPMCYNLQHTKRQVPEECDFTGRPLLFELGLFFYGLRGGGSVGVLYSVV